MVLREERGIRRWRSIALIGVGLVASCAGTAGAQTSPVPATDAPALVVTSDPPGVVVTLKGPYEWIGMTPWTLHRSISGLYQVEARLPGYETWKSEVVLGDGGVRSLDLRLSRKSTARALLRSAVIPGWGQIYRGSKGKGALFLVGSCGAAAAFGSLASRYQDKVDDFDARRHEYERATSLDQIETRYAAMARASARADDAWSDRRIALGALAGIYSLNLLDLLFFQGGGEAQVGGFSSGSERPALPVALNATPGRDGSVQAALRWTW